MPMEEPTEIDIEPDYAAIDGRTLTRYPVAPELEGEQLVVAMEMDQVVTQGIRTNDAKREYTVTIEYRPEGWTVDDRSVAQYLGTYRECLITQEAMTQLIARDLEHALDLGSGEVFVQVKRNAPSWKMTRQGRVK